MLKQRLVNTLRSTGLLPLAERVNQYMDSFRSRAANRRFVREHPDFPVPPKHLAYDAYSTTNWDHYYSSGLEAAQYLMGIIDQHYTGDNSRKLDVCEWGCGPARVIRRFHELAGTRQLNLYGTDYNKETIAWNKSALSDIRFFTNSSEPPLPFEDQSMDFIYNISVFTHLSERLHHLWIDELRRVIRPDGLLVLTTHGDSFRKILLPNEQERFDAGQLVVRSGVLEGSRTFVAFHPTSFVRDKLLKDFLVLKHVTSPLNQAFDQDFWVIRPEVGKVAMDQ